MGKDLAEQEKTADTKLEPAKRTKPRPKIAAQPEAEGPHKDEALETLRSGYEKVENTHKTADLLANGAHIKGTGFKGLSKAITKDSLELWKDEASLTSKTMTVSGAALGAFGVIDGIAEIIEAGGEDNLEDAAAGYMSGASNVVGGGASMLALGGTAAPVAPIAASFGTGVKVGKYGNHAVQEYGWFNNDDGEAQTASSWAADTAGKADDYVSEHVGHGALGKAAGFIAGNTTLAGTTIVATGASIGAATDKAVISPMIKQSRQDGKNIANAKRAAVYAGAIGKGDLDATDGIGYRDPNSGKVEIVERDSFKALDAGKQMANYDDEREDAITASQVLHPERWGLPQNAYSMMYQLGTQGRGENND
ncbi:MAG: hypothetical protein QM831_25830 [Kofleriaceae bacterium]